MENDIQKRDILEQTSCISFYAAECSEFPVLGEVHHDLNLPDALEAYEKIPAERMNGLKSVGFNLQERNDGSDGCRKITKRDLRFHTIL